MKRTDLKYSLLPQIWCQTRNKVAYDTVAKGLQFPFFL